MILVSTREPNGLGTIGFTIFFCLTVNLLADGKPLHW